MLAKQKKNSCFTYHSFNVFFSITTDNFLTTGSKLQASAFHLCFFSLHFYAAPLQPVLETPSQENFGKFQESGETRFGGSENDRVFLKISKWQHKLVRDNKWGKLVSYFLNNAAKTYLYGLKLSENIEIEHVFQSKSFLHFISNLHTGCPSAFKTIK